jgi:hypothetical protein
MAKYLILLKIHSEKFPADPKAYMKVLGPMLDLTKKDLKEGKLRDWGYFVGGNGGYAISEQTPEDLTRVAMQMSPYVDFEVRQVLSISDLENMVKTMMP